MSQKQQPKPIDPKKADKNDQIKIEHRIEPPGIQDTLDKAKMALGAAQKAKQKQARRHVCAICDIAECPHYERRDLDTGEEFIIAGPDRGK